MPDYKKLYLNLFNTLTDIAEKIKNAQQQAEHEIIENNNDEKEPIKFDKFNKK